MQTTEKNINKHKVSPFAEIGECQTTGNKSLYATAEFKPGEVISDFGYYDGFWRYPLTFQHLLSSAENLIIF